MSITMNDSDISGNSSKIAEISNGTAKDVKAGNLFGGKK